MFYISGPNLVILELLVDELSHGQTHDWRTHRQTDGHTHAGNDNTWRPKLASGKKGQCHLLITWLHIALETVVNAGWGNAMSPYSTMPLAQTNVDSLSIRSGDTHLKALSQQIPQPSSTKICFYITPKFHPNLPGANESDLCSTPCHIFIRGLDTVMIHQGAWT